MLDPNDHRIMPDVGVDLDAIPSEYDGPIERDDGEKQLKKLSKRLVELQERMYAEGRHALLVVFQAMDAGGKDSTVRKVFGPVNPAGCGVTSFKKPTDEELAHDYLWRVHKACPREGTIGVFNRSHYEDVLVVRVLGLVPDEVWRARYEQINAFERMLVAERTHVLKFCLHISKDYQKQRFQRRLDRPEKHWKFNPADLDSRAKWGDYRAAYNEALSRCSTDAAPWYVVPAETRWFRNLLVAQTVVNKLESLDMQYPEPDFDPASITLE